VIFASNYRMIFTCKYATHFHHMTVFGTVFLLLTITVECSVFPTRLPWRQDIIKSQKDKHRSTKHTHKTKDRVTRTPLKTGGELRCPGRVGSSCSKKGVQTSHKTLISYSVVFTHLVCQVKFIYTVRLLSLKNDINYRFNKNLKVICRLYITLRWIICWLLCNEIF
jgi:hypothetical protein